MINKSNKKKLLKFTMLLVVLGLVSSFSINANASKQIDGIDLVSSMIEKSEMNIGDFSTYCVETFDLLDVTPAENSFVDLSDFDFNRDNVLRMVAKKYILGNGDGYIFPNDKVTKERARIILSRISAESLDSNNFDEVDKLPNVTSNMMYPDYWYLNASDYEKEIMTQKQIKEFNKKIIETKETNTYDLKKEKEIFDGKSKAIALANFENPKGSLYLNGELIDSNFFEEIKTNILEANVTSNMKIKYAVAVNRSCMKAYPYDGILTDDLNDDEWDNYASAAVKVNEPLIVYFTTKDGKFSLVKSPNCSGWINTEDIAIFKTRKDFEKIIDLKKFLIVYDSKIYLEKSNDKNVSEKMLTMGTKLEIENGIKSLITNRLSFNNYTVILPGRDSEGFYLPLRALIPASKKVNVGYLKYNIKNIMLVAFNELGSRYGWGGSLLSEDCSGYVRDIYSCFGFDLPRNTTWQAAMPADVTNLKEMTNEEKIVILDSLMPGSILQIPGHEMLYIGKVDGLYYTINDVYSIVNQEAPEEGIIAPKSVVISDLTTMRGNKTNWLDNLSYSISIK